MSCLHSSSLSSLNSYCAERQKPSQSWEGGAAGSEDPEELLLDFDVCGEAN